MKLSRVPDVGGGPMTGNRRQAGVYIGPGPRPVWPAPEGIGGQRAINVTFGNPGKPACPRLGDNQAIKPDLQFDQPGDAMARTIGDFARLDAPRGVGNIGILLANPGAKQLDATAGAGRFDDRRIILRPGALDLFGDRCGKGLYRR